ncbi:hypothetical protein PDY_08560 [Photobacterium damselae subsp. damselae]|nr:hypothetical protein CTN07_09305 [Photobacterium damselae]BDR33808.1 hypothetical protein PDY_08560 [Photobacterium damselae subsp. damselae]
MILFLYMHLLQIHPYVHDVLQLIGLDSYVIGLYFILNKANQTEELPMTLTGIEAISHISITKSGIILNKW